MKDSSGYIIYFHPYQIKLYIASYVRFLIVSINYFYIVKRIPAIIKLFADI